MQAASKASCCGRVNVLRAMPRAAALTTTASKASPVLRSLLPQRRLGANGPLVSSVGLGCMPLSLAGRRPEEESVSVIHAALDAGITLFDTADVYCTDDSELGHNERLLRRALASYGGDASEVVVATKGIMSRPNGEWVAGSDPDALFSACDRSLEALGVDCLDLYYLHTPSGLSDLNFARAVANLRTLQSEGKVRHVGLSNVSVDQLIASQAAVEVAAVQNRCNVFDPTSFADGVVGQCKQTGVAFVPYAPVGGRGGKEAAASRAELLPVCERLECSPQEAMLSWLLQIDDCILPIPGATQPPRNRRVARRYPRRDAAAVLPTALTAAARLSLRRDDRSDRGVDRARRPARPAAWEGRPHRR